MKTIAGQILPCDIQDYSRKPRCNTFLIGLAVIRYMYANVKELDKMLSFYTSINCRVMSLSAAVAVLLFGGVLLLITQSSWNEMPENIMGISTNEAGEVQQIVGVAEKHLNGLRLERFVNVDKWSNERKLIGRAVEADLRCLSGPGGRWERFRSRPLQGTYRPDSTDNHICQPVVFNESTKPGLWYTWQTPQLCPFLSIQQCANPEVDKCDFDIRALCEAIHGRELVFIGDSTLFTSHNILTLLMLRDQPLPYFVDQFKNCPAYKLCGNFSQPTTTRYVRNDHLVFTEEDILSARRKANVYAFPFMHLVTNNSILILNRGAHFEPTDLVIPALRKLFLFLREYAPGAVLLYQHTPLPVHSDLLAQVPAAKPISVKIENEAWGWQHFSRQNQDVQRFLHQEFPEVMNVNPQYMISFRVDNRLDQVHSCVPGFGEWIVALLSHAIIKMHTLENELV